MGLLGAAALADEPISNVNAERPTKSDVVAPPAASPKGPTSAPTAQSPALAVPAAIDIVKDEVVSRPIILLRRVEELPLGASVRLLGLPTGATLSGGQANPGNGWIVPLWALENIELRLPPGGLKGEAEIAVALVDNHNTVIEEHTMRLRTRPAADAAPAIADHDQAPSTAPVATPAMQEPALAGRETAPNAAVVSPDAAQKNAVIDHKPPPSATAMPPLGKQDNAAGRETAPSAAAVSPDAAQKDAVIDHEAPPSATAMPSPGKHDNAAVRDAASDATAAAPAKQTHTAEITPGRGANKEASDHPIALTSAEFEAAGLRFIKQIGLPNNHRHTTGIAVADPYSTDFAMVDDLTRALAHHPTSADLFVYPTPGSGGLKPVRDVLTLPSTDFAIVSLPVMNKLRRTKAYGDIDKRLTLVGPLLTEELHLLATKSAIDMRDLTGKTVSLGSKGSLSATLGHDVLAALGIKAIEVNLDLDDAIDAMRTGKVAAVLLISGKPVRHLTEHTPPVGTHLLPIPYGPAFGQDFVRASLSQADYPELIAGPDVQTIGVRSGLWAYRWPEQSERYRLVELVLDRMTKHLAELRSGAFHPKWKEVDLSGSVAGWSRFYLSKGGAAENAKSN